MPATAMCWQNWLITIRKVAVANNMEQRHNGYMCMLNHATIWPTKENEPTKSWWKDDARSGWWHELVAGICYLCILHTFIASCICKMTIINSKLNIAKKPKGKNERKRGGAHKNKKGKICFNKYWLTWYGIFRMACSILFFFSQWFQYLHQAHFIVKMFVMAS